MKCSTYRGGQGVDEVRVFEVPPVPGDAGCGAAGGRDSCAGERVGKKVVTLRYEPERVEVVMFVGRCAGDASHLPPVGIT